MTFAVDVLLQLYPERFRARGVSLPPDGPGFSGAIVLRVETAAGPLCLRGWPADADAERIGGLHRLLKHVTSQEIGFVACPVPANDGRTLVSAAGRNWQLEPWLPGRADFLSRPSDGRLSEALRSLARLHTVMARFEPRGRDASWFFSHAAMPAPAAVERAERLAGWSDEKLALLCHRIEQTPECCEGFNAAATAILGGFSRHSKVIAAELRSASRLPVPVQPCLRDVWHDHLLFEGDTITGIVDPGAARSDTVAADISRLVGSLVADDRRRWEVAIEAYQQVRPLTSDERTLVGVLDRSGTLLSGMTWLARRFFTNATIPQPERVVGRMEKIAGRLAVL
jgi:Ser/Thr protein kinase RdoA (MazF antagonist)